LYGAVGQGWGQREQQWQGLVCRLALSLRWSGSSARRAAVGLPQVTRGPHDEEPQAAKNEQKSLHGRCHPPSAQHAAHNFHDVIIAQHEQFIWMGMCGHMHALSLCTLQRNKGAPAKQGGSNETRGLQRNRWLWVRPEASLGGPAVSTWPA
jgi:hypothetical protein